MWMSKMNYHELYHAAGGRWKRLARFSFDLVKVAITAALHGTLILPAVGFWVTAIAHDEPGLAWENILEFWKSDPQYWEASIVAMMVTAMISALFQWRRLGETHQRAMLRHLKESAHIAPPATHTALQHRIEPVL
jgi:hypothetical protein